MRGLTSIAQGSETWNAHCSIPRHRHEWAYAAVVLSGGYEESGSFGRYRVRSGHVLLHRAFDAHVDRFESSGARILNLLLNEPPAFGLGVVADPDTIARVAEKDLPAAVDALRETMTSIEPQPADWPDLLAYDLLDDPQLRLETWAERHGMAAATLSRGFRAIFATSPAAFRAESRAQSALALITAGGSSLAEIAAVAGFADQPHMTRAVRALTGRPPGDWLRSNRFKTRRMAPLYKEA
jgi:AraC-like DNA-binding protein